MPGPTVAPDVTDPSQRRARRRGALLLLCSCCLLLQPVVGNGPGPDPRTVYGGDPVDPEAEATEGALALHPAVNGDFVITGAVERAAVDPIGTAAANVSGNLRALTDAAFYWDGDGQYYAVNATVTDGTYRLDARPVDARTALEALAVPADEADGPVASAARPPDYRAVVDEGTDRTASADPTLVATDDGYALVTRSYEPARDPLRPVKLAGYALAGSGIVLGVLLPALQRPRRE